MTHILTLIIILAISSCANSPENDQTVKSEMIFTETGLKVACTRTIKMLDNEIHGAHYTTRSGSIDKDSIIRLLYSISLLDDFKETNSKKYSNKAFVSWAKTSMTPRCFKLEKTEFIMENPSNLKVYNPIETAIALTDFDIYLNVQTKRISLRFLNDYEVIRVVVDKDEIQRVSESIPRGLQNAIRSMDSLKQKQNARR